MISEVTNIVKQLDKILDAMELNPVPLTDEFFAIGRARLSLLEAVMLRMERNSDNSLEAGIQAIHAVVTGSK